MTTVERPWTITNHAWHRAQAMGVDRAAILAVIEDATTTWTTGENRKVMKGNGLALVVCPENRAVITVLYDKEEQWER